MGLKDKNNHANGYVVCPYCREELPVEWDDLTCDNLLCPKCNNAINIEYDEDYDFETGEENCYWWAEKLIN